VSEVLVWLVLDVVFRQTTFVPGAMVMVAGRNAKFTIFTVWEAAGESPCAISASETAGKASRGQSCHREYRNNPLHRRSPLSRPRQLRS
jgi:hypothetical protein